MHSTVCKRPTFIINVKWFTGDRDKRAANKRASDRRRDHRKKNERRKVKNANSNVEALAQETVATTPHLKTWGENEQGEVSKKYRLRMGNLTLLL
ncbi:hypothetical protein DXG01_009903 [Tephrocybe rancida]|nr:hypothetical protein DXG01_009903 [Tephrocybe rancida]